MKSICALAEHSGHGVLELHGLRRPLSITFLKRFAIEAIRNYITSTKPVSSLCLIVANAVLPMFSAGEPQTCFIPNCPAGLEDNQRFLFSHALNRLQSGKIHKWDL
jgi:hypothetical protein